MKRQGLLYSQIGYDYRCPMRAVFRASERSDVPDDAHFTVSGSGTSSSELVQERPLQYWGSCWGEHWWIIDFSGLEPGHYHLQVHGNSQTLAQSETIEVGLHVLWDRTIERVAIAQFEERAKRARNGIGWKDCGSNLRECTSHAISVIGLCELSFVGNEWLTPSQNQRVIAQIIHGCDYLAHCQEKAVAVGLPEGSIVHELTNSAFVVPTNTAMSAVALAFASRIVHDTAPDEAEEFMQRARRSHQYLQLHGNPFSPRGFSHLNHGAPEGYIPPREPMTRELLMRLWLAIELWISGGEDIYQEEAVELARRIISRQVTEEQAEGGFHGHFRTFDHSPFTEKANIHHHVGHDTGGVYPFYVVPLTEMLHRWPDHPEAPVWREAVRRFAHGFFIPACQANPFHLLPSGYFRGEGLLSFCGPWHGINVSYALAAILALQLGRVTQDSALRDICVGNLQWIAGLNAGLHADMFSSCIRFAPTIPEAEVLPYSMIEGIGARSVKGWSELPGSIVNGFSVNPQFTLSVPATKENDGPHQFTDEDWIPHGAAWAAALGYLRQHQFFTDYKGT